MPCASRRLLMTARAFIMAKASNFYALDDDVDYPPDLIGGRSVDSGDKPTTLSASIATDVDYSAFYNGLTDHAAISNFNVDIRAVSFVIKTTDTACYALNRYASASDYYSIGIRSNSLRLYSDEFDIVTSVNSATAADGSPHSIIVDYDGAKTTVYFDGVDVGSVTSANNPFGGINATQYFAREYTGSYDLTGNLSLVAFYTTSLGLANVEELHSLMILSGSIVISVSESSALEKFTVMQHRSTFGEGVIDTDIDTSVSSSHTVLDVAIEPMFITVSPKIDGSWKSKTDIPLDYLVIATDPTATPHLWKCTTAGTTHATTEPTWNLSGTTTDGTVTWTYVDELVQPVTHGPLIPS